MAGNSKNINGIATVDSVLNQTINHAIGNKSDTVGGNSLVSLTKQIILAVGGEASQLRTAQSISAPVEEDGIISFLISVFDVDNGAITTANIDISGISATLEKSTGGGAFSVSGITQPTFAKNDGLVSVDYRFLAAEWINGDVYKLTVSGITATIGSDTAYVKTCVWSNVVLESANVEAKINTIDGIVDAILVDTGTTLPATLTNMTIKIDDVQTTASDIETDVHDLQTQIGTAGAGLTDLGGMSTAMKGEVNTEVDGALNTIVPASPTAGSMNDILSKAAGSNTFDKSTDSLEALRDRIDTLNIADQADLDAIKAVTDNLPDTGALTTLQNNVTDILTDTGTTIPGTITNLQSDVTAIKAITDVIPDAGAMTSLAQKAENSSGDSSGTFSYLDAGGEQDVIAISNSTRKIIYGVWLDLSNMTQNGTVKLYYKIDGTNYRQVNMRGTVQSYAFTVATGVDGLYINLTFAITNDFKITYTEGADEGAARDILYSVIYRTIE